MNENEKILSVEKGAYFPMPVVVIGAILIAGAFSVFVLWLYQAIRFQSSLMGWGDIMVNFLLRDLPIMLLLTAVGLLFLLSKRIFQFNPERKESRELFRFFHWEWGNWNPLVLDGICLAFQRYGQTYNYNYGGLYEKKVFEYIYELRLIYGGTRYKAIVSGSDFYAVSQILVMGRKMGEVYGLPFNDYVMDLIKKQYRNATRGGIV